MTSHQPEREAAAARPHPSHSVTVSIARTVDPDRLVEATEWVKAGMDLAARYPGYLGSGWVSASEESASWHMLYKFSDAARLDAWQNSAERTAWLHEGRDLVLDAREEKRTGIEGWFDAPDAGATDPTLVPPPRWKQAVSIWLGFFPLNLAFTLLVTWLVPGWGELATIPKVLLTTIVLTPIMAYFVLPWVTRMLRPWLTRQPRP